MNQLDLPASTSRIGSRMVGRWNYMDLTPLKESDLVNMDYVESKDSSSLTPPSTFALFKNKNEAANGKNHSSIVMPDLSAMVPFKPRSNNRGFLRVKGESGDELLNVCHQ